MVFESIRDNLHVFYSSNYGSNVFLLIGRKTALIDASVSSNGPELISGLNSLGIKPEQIDLVLFTHGHADHYGCTDLFPKAKKRMSPHDAEKIELRDSAFTCSAVVGETHYPKIDSFLEKDELIEFSPFSLKVLSTPGHTLGSVCFHDEKLGLLFSGDTLFNGSCGRTDLPSGNNSQMTESLESLSKLSFKTLLPGHGLVLKGEQKTNISVVLKSFRQQYF